MSTLKLDAAYTNGNSPRGESLTRRIARAWGRTEAGASQALYNPISGIPAKFGKLLGDLRRFGARELAWSMHRKNEALLREGPHQPVTPLRLAEHEAVDSHEDVIRARYIATRDPKERARWKAAVLREIADKIELYDAMCAEDKGDV